MHHLGIPLRFTPTGNEYRQAPHLKKSNKHIIIPLIISAIFFVVAWLPVDLLGCRNRGLITALLAIAAGTLGIVAAVKGLIDKVKGDSNSFLWMASALILAIPAIFILLVAI